jgi:hypothetical protein
MLIIGGMRGMSYSLNGGYKVGRSSTLSLNLRNIARTNVSPGHASVAGTPLSGAIAFNGEGVYANMATGVSGIGDSLLKYSRGGLVMNLARTNGKITEDISARNSAFELTHGSLSFKNKYMSIASNGMSNLNLAPSKFLNISGSNFGRPSRQVKLDYADNGFKLHAAAGAIRGLDITVPKFHGVSVLMHGLGGIDHGLDFSAPMGFLNLTGSNLGGVGQSVSMAGKLPMTTKFLVAQVMNGASKGTTISMTSGLGMRDAQVSVSSNTAARTSLFNFTLPVIMGFKLSGHYSTGVTSRGLLSLLRNVGKTGSLSFIVQSLNYNSTSTLGFYHNGLGLSWNLACSNIRNLGVDTTAISGGFSGSLSKVTSLSVTVQRSVNSSVRNWNCDTLSFSNKLNSTNFITVASTYNDSPGAASSVNISYETEWR